MRAASARLRTPLRRDSIPDVCLSENKDTPVLLECLPSAEFTRIHIPMLQFANEQIASRLANVMFQARRVAVVQDVESVHDLRVGIRRFSQSILAFSSLLPKAEVKRVRRQLNRMMDAAGEVRERDIALQFIDDAGVSPDDPLRSRIVSERALAERILVEKARRWSRASRSRKWRAALRLNAS